MFLHNEFDRKIYEPTRFLNQIRITHACIILCFVVCIKKKKKVQTPFFIHRTAHDDDNDAGESKKYNTRWLLFFL